MEVHNAIARWESEGGAIPQVQRSRKPESEQIKPLTVRRILVPIDFSPESLKALRYAKRLVERFKAKLHMVHVVTPPLVLFPQPRQVLPPNFTEEMVGNAIDRFEEVVRDFSLPLRHRHYTVRIGAVPHEINEVARITRTDFIAIATRGYSGLKRAFLGSTTESVVRNAPCPVLVVREKDGSTQPRARKGPLQFRKILVPLDFSEPSRLGLEYALSFAQEFHATVVLFHSVFVSRICARKPIHCEPNADADCEPARLRKSRDGRAAGNDFSQRRPGRDKDRRRLAGGANRQVCQKSGCGLDHHLDAWPLRTAPHFYREHGRTYRALRDMPCARGAEPAAGKSDKGGS